MPSARSQVARLPLVLEAYDHPQSNQVWKSTGGLASDRNSKRAQGWAPAASPHIRFIAQAPVQTLHPVPGPVGISVQQLTYGETCGW